MAFYGLLARPFDAAALSLHSGILCWKGNDMAIQIRRARATDAAEAIDVLRRSITDLCVADHQNDPADIEGWLSNKTVAAWQTWIARHDAVVLVAERDIALVSVGMATLSGEILLNYVHPDARFSGVSKAMLAALEDILRASGVQRSMLESTRTATSFYAGCGFKPEADNARILTKHL